MEFEVDKPEAKTEMNLECSGEGDMTEVENKGVLNSCKECDFKTKNKGYLITHIQA